MTVTLLNSPPDLSDQAVRHTQRNVDLLILPPLSGMEGTIQGDLNVCERYIYFPPPFPFNPIQLILQRKSTFLFSFFVEFQ